MLVAIDPSLHACGWAKVAKDGTVCGSGVFHDPVVYGLIGLLQVRFELCLIEVPKIYPHSPVPPNDIAALSRVVGMAEALATANAIPVKLVKPTPLSKQITELRVRDRVHNLDTLIEQVPPSKKHNAIDAIALAFRELGIQGF